MDRWQAYCSDVRAYLYGRESLDPVVDDYDCEYREYTREISRREPEEIPWPDQDGRDIYLRKPRAPKSLVQAVLDKDTPLDYIESRWGMYGLPEVMDGDPFGVRQRWLLGLGKPIVVQALRDAGVRWDTPIEGFREILFEQWHSLPKLAYLTPATSIYRVWLDSASKLLGEHNPARFLRFDLAPQKPVVAQLLMRFHEVEGMGHLRARKTFPEEVLRLARRHERKYLPYIG